MQVLVTYGSRVVAAGASSDPYGQRYKGIWICLELLKRALAGNYVNFGVFELYGDPALKVHLSVDLSAIQGTHLYIVMLSAFTLPCSQAFNQERSTHDAMQTDCAARSSGIPSHATWSTHDP